MLNESVCIIWAAFEETALSIKHPMHAAATSAVPTRDMVIFPPLSPIRSRPANNKLITFHYSWHPGARRYEKRSGRTKNAIICRWPVCAQSNRERALALLDPEPTPCAERLGRVGTIGAPEKLREAARIAEAVLGGNPGQ